MAVYENGVLIVRGKSFQQGLRIVSAVAAGGPVDHHKVKVNRTARGANCAFYQAVNKKIEV